MNNKINNYIIKLENHRTFIRKYEAINYFKKQGYIDITLYYEKNLGQIKINDKIYLISDNFGAIPLDLIKHLKKLLNFNESLVFLWPKSNKLKEIPIYIMNPINETGVLIKSKYISFIK